MFVLDTNVLSELMRSRPDPAVMARIAALPLDQVSITSVTVAEILYGLDIMPAGKRKSQLVLAVTEMLEKNFAGRILDFDAAAAVEYATLAGARQRSGRPISFADAQIAAICRSHNAELLTRNTRDFESTGVRVSNPFGG